MYKKIYLFSCCVSFSAIGYCQEGKIETDRPDQTESPFLTPKNWVQLEAGFNIQQTTKNVKEYLSPTLLSKLGISKHVELRLITSMATTKTTHTANSFTETGLLPVEIGAKILLCEENKFTPKTSFIFHFALPKLAGKYFKANKIAPNFRFVMQNTLSKTVGLG